jgi:hypothetical protein
VLARDVDGATFWGALDEALVPRLKAADNGVHGEAALADFGKVFQGRALKQGTRIILAWVQPSNLKVLFSLHQMTLMSDELYLVFSFLVWCMSVSA